jgi:CheY-like chemotaxis protein
VQFLQEIENAALRSRELTGQLLAFSRKQIIAPKTVDLNAHLQATSKTLMRLIGEDIELRFIPAEGLWYTRIDPLQVDQIIMNLAVNARDAMPKGGTLTIGTSNVHLDEEQCSRYADCLPGSYVQLAVSDSGNGMDRDTLSHIFEPFFTTKEFGKGTGLGLATIYGIVKQNSGFISVASEKARGSTFTIYLPRTDSEHAGPEAAAPAPEVSGSGTILLVEDDATVRGLVSQLLESLGYTVLPAESPSQALSLCGEADRSIDLLMTDVVMPRMNGKELMERVTKIRPGIKVLFMSGYTASVIATHGVLDDGLYFIQKPFGIDTLAAKVREALTGGS